MVALGTTIADEWKRKKVRDIMTTNLARIAVDKSLHDLTALMHSEAEPGEAQFPLEWLMSYL